ncbi:DNA gyrase/topoisomerase IV, subunit A domain-containing protein [Ditylenchus destructor]|uniref:DNA topoisomerase 2 n=1 Tax=Ditylenchus destructor TaxID=166010 RepID=A0AAD4NLB3_9BILA|nr:DNA gyrase/topoisomerase IV, subunit A domain-containing protein [Ditylenchus destructor]
MVDIEKTYQKKTQLEHILLRPDTYIGSVEFCTKTTMWVYDQEEDKIVQRDISFVPGLYKIFDEILVNAADNKQRDPKMNLIRIDIDKAKNEISILNNGKGIPVVIHKGEKMYVPEMIFGTLLTSSNYNDDERKVTGGRNGFGAKLCNIFSTKFVLETSTKEYGKKFKQTWVNSMTREGEPIVEKCNGDDFTKVTFQPDLKRFGMNELDDDIIGLMCRRAFDVAGTSKGVKVFLNGKQIPCQGFKQYIDKYISDREDETGEPLKVIHEQGNVRWEVGLTSSDKGFQQVSFVNSIATTKGGRHVDYIADQVVAKLIETVKKKVGKNGISIKPFQIKNHMWLFVNALIENPSFDSQTKENMTLQPKSFGSTCELSEKFIKDAQKSGIIESIMSWVRFKQDEQQNKKCSSKKSSKIKGIPKLEDANDAGTKNSHACTLILTEGDSAKTLAVAGLGVIGRDRYGVFPLRGKMLNVRDGNHKQIVENAEINAMLKILGLQYRLKYETDDEIKTLRYGKIMIMADQDQDGSHIKGLVINFIHHNWPNLIKKNFVEEFITPIVKATKPSTKEEFPFYSIPEYVEWRHNTENWKTYRIKYYKGLGTSTSKEAKEYFSDMVRHRIPFKYDGKQDDEAVELAFSKKKIEARKEWLTNWMQIRKERREKNETEDYLYDKDTRVVSFSEFINKELVLFSNADNERSIPCLVDGLKPGQRKVLFTCFKRADKKEVKVAQLAGAVGEMSAYHHGEASLMSTIVNLAHDFIGSNNINLLLPNGQFGTRLQGGKDSASPRYIFTKLNPVTKALFPAADENVLRFQYEENQRIEPEWYCPVIPTVLVNGADGIGTGWSTALPNFNPRDIVENIRRLIKGEPMKPLYPWYRRFLGTIDKLDDSRYVVSGEIATLSDDTLEITELPIKMWTQTYKESVIEPLMEGTITDFKEYHTDQTVKFIIKMTPEKLREAERQGLHNVFKLQNVINTSNMVLFDSNGVLRKFNSPEEICQEFFETRKKIYIERKRWLVGMMRAESDRLSEQARFILLKIGNKIQIENKRKLAIIEQLVNHKFAPDPVKKWKDLQKQRELELCAIRNGAELNDKEKKCSDYDYLVGLQIWKLSEEEKDKLLAASETKKQELATLESKSWEDLWEEDLTQFLIALAAQEKKEEDDIKSVIKNAEKKLHGGKTTGRKNFLNGIADVKPNPNAIRVQPTLDAMKTKYESKTKRENGESAEQKPKKTRQPKKEAVDGTAEPKKTTTKLGKRVATKPALQSKQTTLDAHLMPDAGDKQKAKPAAKLKRTRKDSDDDIILDDIDGEASLEPKPKRARAKPVKYVMSSDSENESPEADLNDSSDSVSFVDSD